MTIRVDWSRFGDGAVELYRRYMVPAVFESLAADLATLAALVPGQRVLDLACGTGVVAREAARRIGEAGRVVGVDFNEAMLAAAAAGAGTSPSACAPVTLVRASALALPLADARFDVVLCQQGLQFFDDKPTALREMRRVLAPGGPLALAVFRRSQGHEAVAEALAALIGREAALAICDPFVFPDGARVAALVAGAGFQDVALTDTVKRARFPTPDAFIEVLVGGRLAAAFRALDEGARSRAIDAARAALRPWADGGALAFPMESNLVTARAPGTRAPLISRRRDARPAQGPLDAGRRRAHPWPRDAGPGVPRFLRRP